MKYHRGFAHGRSPKRGDRTDIGQRRESMTHGSKVKAALEKAIRRAEERSRQVETTGTLDSCSKADAAIRKLRENRRLSREELDRPVTV